MLNQLQYELRGILVLVGREWLRMIAEPSRIAGIVIQPLFFWWVIGSGFMPSFAVKGTESLSYMSFFYPGILAMVVLFSAIFSTITLIDDRSSGFLQMVLVAPMSRFSLVSGKVLGVTSLTCVQVGLLLLISPLAGVHFANVDWFLCFYGIVLGAIALSSLGFIVAWVTDSSAAYHAVMSIVLIPMWVVSGGFFPVQGGWMQVCIAINPVAWLVVVLRGALMGSGIVHATSPSWMSISLASLLLVLFSVCVMSLAVLLCNKKR